ncbi:hypothetical protein M9H77_22290 [Catharanthus roseus]|uniref:Uncharacterized protein n=1 Tax=Catharanthus roseus TaxID=4058 RepID=A0ACC0APP2_CATRO|nr:hypothetical protein M9H77_22290 [Catharanthus roseus]
MGHSVESSHAGLGYKHSSPVRIAIKRANNLYISVEDEDSKMNPKFVFDRLGNKNPPESMFECLGAKAIKTTRKSSFKKHRFSKKSSQKERIGIMTCVDDSANNCLSIIPSRMKRKTTLLLNCISVLKAKFHTIMETRPKAKESVGSSNFVKFSNSTAPLPISRQLMVLVREIERSIKAGYIQRDANIFVKKSEWKMEELEVLSILVWITQQELKSNNKSICYNRLTNERRNKLWTLDRVFITLTQVDMSRALVPMIISISIGVARLEPVAIIIVLNAFCGGLASRIVKAEVFSCALDELPTLVASRVLAKLKSLTRLPSKYYMSLNSTKYNIPF